MTQESCEMRMERESLVRREIVKREIARSRAFFKLRRKKVLKAHCRTSVGMLSPSAVHLTISRSQRDKALGFVPTRVLLGCARESSLKCRQQPGLSTLLTENELSKLSRDSTNETLHWEIIF